MIRKAMLWKVEEGNKVRCFLCSHACLLSEGGFGICGMRQCRKGELFTYSYGEVVASHVDPVEKKPLYHFLPGTTTFSVAAMGCNFTCPFCQNWQISTLAASKGDSGGYELKPEEIVRETIKSGSRSVSYTYTEPTIFFEYAYETAVKATERGLKNIFVTNGYMTAAALDEVTPYLDAANVDLKFFSESKYKEVCGASLKPVLDTIVKMKASGIWLEVTTLLVPRLNDSEKEIRGIAKFLSEVDPEIPWHISRFHPEHKFRDTEVTPHKAIAEAERIGREEGLKYVYPGNIGFPMDTLCPECKAVVVERSSSCPKIHSDAFLNGRCGSCGAAIAGVWS